MSQTDFLSHEFADLLKQRAELDQKIAQARAKEKAAVIDKISEQIALVGLSREDLAEAFKKAKTKARSGSSTQSKAAAKYRNPETGQTWSGRGKEPSWMHGKRDEYRIAAAE